MAEDLLRIEYVPLEEVQRWPRNPKKHDMGALVAAIERYGFVDPPKYDTALGALVYGNGRDEALEWMRAQGRPAPRGIRVDETGRWLVPIKFGVDAPSPMEAEALAIDHNNLTMAGGDFTAFDMARMWDAGYAELLEGLRIDDSLPLTIDEDALASLLAGVGEPVDEGADDAPPVIDEDKPTRVQPGDIWRVGVHLVCCLDSTEPSNLDRALVGQSPAMIWADPPYGLALVPDDGMVGISGATHPHTYEPIAGDESTATARASAGLLLHQYPDAAHVWWGANYYPGVFPDGCSWIVWDKQTIGDVYANCELAATNRQGRVCKIAHQWHGMIKASEQGQARIHPTQKPIALCEWAFEKYGASGDLILDPFLGSGPSLKAAHRMGDRRVVGFELSPHYCDHVLSWAEAAGLTCERQPTHETE